MRRSLFAENATGNLGQSFDDGRNFFTEMMVDVFDGKFGIFHHVVQKGSANGGRAQTDFAAAYFGHCQRMHDVRLSRTTLDAAVSLFSKAKSLGDDVYFFAVVTVEIFLQQVLKFRFNHKIVGRLYFRQFSIRIHHINKLSNVVQFGAYHFSGCSTI